MRRLIPVLAVTLTLGLFITGCDSGPTGQTETPDQKSVHSAATANQSDNAAARSEGTFTRPTWGNDHLWEFLAPKLFGTEVVNPAGKIVFGSPANEASHAPFYIIGPDAGNDGVQSSAFGLGDHDHVVPVPPKNKGTFNANWHIQPVFPVPGEPVAASGGIVDWAHAADIDGDPALEDLTSAEKVQKAAEQGHVTIASTSIVFICPLRDIDG